nr:MAG TPA: hypothetical protein [Caudoviricetes sp.]
MAGVLCCKYFFNDIVYLPKKKKKEVNNDLHI